LYKPFVDDLFVSYGDVWTHIKDYTERYGVMPSFDVVKERFDGDLQDVEVSGKPEYYFDTLRAEFLKNRVENLLIRAGKEFKEGTPPEKIKNAMQDAFSKLDRYDNQSRDLNIMDTEGAKRGYAEVRQKSEDMGGTPGVPTGLDIIDACMPLGMQPGDLIAVIGYPARGKSALSALICAKALSVGYKPLIFSMEMSAEAVRDRIYTILGSGVFSNHELMLGIASEDAFDDFSSKHNGREGWIVDSFDRPEVTPNSIRSKIEQHRPDFVVIDYMQLFYDNRVSEQMTTRMMNLSQELKAISKQYQIPVIVISSATPPDGGKVNEPPNVERTGWSRQLAYDSTVCIAIHRQEGTNIYQLECAKNRYGPLFSGYLIWDMDRGIIQEKTELD
jgi:replicative DNA helicase